MRNLTVDNLTAVEPVRAVSATCPAPISGVNGLPSVPTAAVVDVPQWASPRLRPSSRQWAALGRITAEGAGYGFGSDLFTGIRGAERRAAAAPAAAVQCTTTTARNARSTQSKQLHLMSRRDPCSWRPPV